MCLSSGSGLRSNWSRVVMLNNRSRDVCRYVTDHLDSLNGVFVWFERRWKNCLGHMVRIVSE